MAIRIADYFKKHFVLFGWALVFSQIAFGIFLWIVCVLLAGLSPLAGLLLTLLVCCSQFVLVYTLGKFALRPLEILTRATSFCFTLYCPSCTM